MSPAETYAFVTFLAGALLLVAWLYATTGNERSGAMLKESLLIFVLPMFLVPTQLLRFPLAMFVWVAFEEGLKAFASTRERKPINRFLLVSLFGVWELMLSKPFWGIVIARSQPDLSRLDLLGMVYGTALPALMHTVTAAIYAFRFQGRLWAAFLMCFLVHATWNAVAPTYGHSIAGALAETVLLILSLCAALPRSQRNRCITAIPTTDSTTVV